MSILLALKVHHWNTKFPTQATAVSFMHDQWQTVWLQLMLKVSSSFSNTWAQMWVSLLDRPVLIFWSKFCQSSTRRALRWLMSWMCVCVCVIHLLLQCTLWVTVNWFEINAAVSWDSKAVIAPVWCVAARVVNFPEIWYFQKFSGNFRKH